MQTVRLRVHYSDLAKMKAWRIYRWVITFVLISAIIIFLVLIPRWYTGKGLTSIMIILYANFNMLIAFHRCGCHHVAHHTHAPPHRATTPLVTPRACCLPEVRHQPSPHHTPAGSLPCF